MTESVWSPGLLRGRSNRRLARNPPAGSGWMTEVAALVTDVAGLRQRKLGGSREGTLPQQTFEASWVRGAAISRAIFGRRFRFGGQASCPGPSLCWFGVLHFPVSTAAPRSPGKLHAELHIGTPFRAGMAFVVPDFKRQSVAGHLRREQPKARDTRTQHATGNWHRCALGSRKS